MRLLVMAIVAMIALSCSKANYPSAPDEQWIASVIMNECKVLGLDVVTDFREEDRILDGSLYGFDYDPTACMAGDTNANTVWIYPACQDEADLELLKAYARHECCHIYLGHVAQLDDDCYIAQEIAADQCAKEMF